MTRTHVVKNFVTIVSKVRRGRRKPSRAVVPNSAGDRRRTLFAY